MKISLLFIIICFIICSIVSCSDELVRTCAAGPFSTNIKNETLSQSQFRPFDFSTIANTIYYQYEDSGKVRFEMGSTITNICPYENIKVNFSWFTSTIDQPIVFTMIGRISWSTFNSGFSSTLFIVNDSIVPDSLYLGDDEYDFNNDFGDNMAIVEAFIGVEFVKLNSFEEDSTYFVDHIDNLQIEAEGNLFR